MSNGILKFLRDQKKKTKRFFPFTYSVSQNSPDFFKSKHSAIVQQSVSFQKYLKNPSLIYQKPDLINQSSFFKRKIQWFMNKQMKNKEYFEGFFLRKKKDFDPKGLKWNNYLIKSYESQNSFFNQKKKEQYKRKQQKVNNFNKSFLINSKISRSLVSLLPIKEKFSIHLLRKKQHDEKHQKINRKLMKLQGNLKTKKLKKVKKEKTITENFNQSDYENTYEQKRKIMNF